MSNVVKVKNLNKTLHIDEGRLSSYLRNGYDQIDEVTEEIIKRATGGRTVSLAEFNNVVDENEKLKAENSKLKSEVAKLKKEAAAK